MPVPPNARADSRSPPTGRTDANAAPSEAPMATAADFHPEVLRLFDKYVHGIIDRRGFLSGAARFATAGVTAAGLLDALSPRFAYAQKVTKDDPRLKTETIQFESPKGYGKASGYLVRPANATGKLPGVLVIHENRGLNPHIEDIARRIALDNFVAFAPDALFTLGGYPGDEDKARELFPKLDQSRTREDFVAAAGLLRTHAAVNGRIGVVGFCYGGGIANLLATRLPELAAAVPYYGAAPSAEEAARIKAKMLIHYAGNDERINAGWPAYEEALKKSGVRYEAFIYPNTEHGFNNDTTPRYDEAAARQSWERTIALFNQALRV
jgi:carboxymethylenebutenolidase